jgi:membrane-bound ClpP family serine protease
MLLRKMVAAVVALLWFCGMSMADTFTDQKTGEVLHGYIAGKGDTGTIKAVTQEKGEVELNAAKYSIVRDGQGRKNKVAVLAIDGAILLECQTKALVKAIAKESSDGPQFILIEMDTPGGRLDLAKEICAAIDGAGSDVVVFIKGGKYGGAISAGAAVALACNKVYIAKTAVFGGATVVTMQNNQLADIRKVAGDDVGEKISSIWRGSMASMAENRGRSGLIAKAMVDRQIAVTEVSRDSKRMFVEPQDMKAGDVVVKKWNSRGRLITLTGEEAVKSGMADAIAESRQDVLAGMKVADATVAEDKSVPAALTQFNGAKARKEQVVRSLNAKFELLASEQTRAGGMKLIREIKSDLAQLVVLGKTNPDMNMDVGSLQNEYARVEAAYKQAVRN